MAFKMAFPPICCALADKEKGGGGREQHNKRGENKTGFLSQTVPKAAPRPCKALAHRLGRGQWHWPQTILPPALPSCSPGHFPDMVRSAVTQILAEQHLATPSTPRAAQPGASMSKSPQANFVISSASPALLRFSFASYLPSLTHLPLEIRTPFSVPSLLPLCPSLPMLPPSLLTVP